MFGQMKKIKMHIQGIFSRLTQLDLRISNLESFISNDNIRNLINELFEKYIDNKDDGSYKKTLPIFQYPSSFGPPYKVLKEIDDGKPSFDIDPEVKINNKLMKLLDYLMSSYTKKYLKENIKELIEQEWFIDLVVEKINNKQLKN